MRACTAPNNLSCRYLLSATQTSDSVCGADTSSLFALISLNINFPVYSMRSAFGVLHGLTDDSDPEWIEAEQPRHSSKRRSSDTSTNEGGNKRVKRKNDIES